MRAKALENSDFFHVTRFARFRAFHVIEFALVRD